MADTHSMGSSFEAEDATPLLRLDSQPANGDSESSLLLQEKKRDPFWYRALLYLRSRIFPGWDRDEREGAAWYAARFGECVIGLLGGIAACASFWAGNFQLGFTLVPIIVLTVVGVTLTVGVEVEPWQYYVGDLFGQWVESFYNKGRIKQALKHVSDRKKASDQADKSYKDSKQKRADCVKQVPGIALTARDQAEVIFEIALLKYRLKTTPQPDNEWEAETDPSIQTWDAEYKAKLLAKRADYQKQLRDLGITQSELTALSAKTVQGLDAKPHDFFKTESELEHLYNVALKDLTLKQQAYLQEIKTPKLAADKAAAQSRAAYLGTLPWKAWWKAVRHKKNKHDEQATLLSDEQSFRKDERDAREAAAWLSHLENEKDHLTLLQEFTSKEVELRRIAAQNAFALAHEDFWTRAKVWWREFFTKKNMLRKLMWLTVFVNSSTVAMACALWFLYFFGEVAGLATGTALPICIVLGVCYLISSVSFNKFLIDGLFQDTEDAPPKFMEDPHYRRAYAKAKTLSYVMGALAGFAFTGLAVATILSLPWSWPVIISLCVVGGLCILVCQTMVATSSIENGFRRALEKKYQKHLIIEALKTRPIYTPENAKEIRNAAEMPQTLWSRFKEFCLWVQSANRGFFTGAFITKTFLDFVGSLGLDPSAGPLIIGLTVLGYVGGIVLAALYVPYDYHAYNGYHFKTQRDTYLGKDEEDDSFHKKPNYIEKQADHLERTLLHRISGAMSGHFWGCSFGCTHPRQQEPIMQQAKKSTSCLSSVLRMFVA